jgi:hypothetical protein
MVVGTPYSKFAERTNQAGNSIDSKLRAKLQAHGKRDG